MNITGFPILLYYAFKKVSDTGDISRSTGGTWSTRQVIGYIFVQ